MRNRKLALGLTAAGFVFITGLGGRALIPELKTEAPTPTTAPPSAKGS